MNQKLIFAVLKHKWWWLALSTALLVPCILAMIYSCITNSNHAPIKLGIDFTGGTILQYSVEQDLEIKDVEKVRAKLIEAGIKSPVVQNITATEGIRNIISIKTEFIGQDDTETQGKIEGALSELLNEPELVQVSSVGPTLGKELLKNSMVAVALAFLAISIYISVRFQREYAIVAFLKVLHDLIFIIGIFSVFSILFGMHVDSLFITAVLTSIAYSIHDNIVVFDRIRENNRFLSKKHTFEEIINASVSQTLARSINTTLTLLFVLFALYFFGGGTTKNFVLAMILGVSIGTYSSIFFASVILHMFMEKSGKKAATEAQEA
jgi:preprotein translocase subunit SecF